MFKKHLLQSIFVLAYFTKKGFTKLFIIQPECKMGFLQCTKDGHRNGAGLNGQKSFGRKWLFWGKRSKIIRSKRH